MPDTVTNEIIKRGETCVRYKLAQRAKGLSMTVWALPQVEEFMSRLGHGRQTPVETIGRFWASAKDPFTCYSLNEYAQAPDDDGRLSYKLDRIGYPLIGDGEPVNISFLRLCGISEGVGVTFDIKGVYSLAALRDMDAQVGNAIKKFYSAFMRPVDLVTTISTQEMTF